MTMTPYLILAIHLAKLLPSLSRSESPLKLMRFSAINCFTNLANESKEVPTLHNKTYNNFKLNWSDWRHLRLIHRVLKEPATAQQSFLSAKHLTAWKTIPTLECLADPWRSMADDPQYVPIADTIKAGLKNVNKYFKKTNQSDMYFICLGQWDTEDVADGRAHLEAMFNDYYTLPSRTPTKEQSAPPTRAVCKHYGDNWMCEAIRTHQTSGHLTHNPWQELNMYLSSPLEETDDIVAWWGWRKHQSLTPLKDTETRYDSQIFVRQ
ncbi:uncharacterized protein BJ212DRAFT_1299943 [Suillus subaureus]|uniref:Uncharacterized protein n=1 Tax=Suillus subaureus TaxID=48587 RepID=A0A9P7EB31_9AGAM|nr:uncharacterized protein BJ212DRAFT_1299943 [Suillus subaureus]KAG1816122.1 hypothetical protein BJ212DRAFT_1299943 [Suillus subaureus]